MSARTSKKMRTVQIVGAALIAGYALLTSTGCGDFNKAGTRTTTVQTVPGSDTPSQ